MAEVQGTTTFSTVSGNTTVSLGFQPNVVEVTVAGKTGGDTYFHKSEGSVVGSNQKVFSYTGSSSSEPINGKIISLKNASGTVVFEASFVAFTATGVTFNVTTPSPSTDFYQAFLKARS